METIAKNYQAFFAILLEAINDPTTFNPKNLFFSPISIFLCLSFLLTGLDKQTESELLGVLSQNTAITADPFLLDLSKLMHQILEFKNSADKKPISISNGLFVEESFPLLPSFLEKVQKLFLTTFSSKSLDFKNQPEDSRKLINDWVASQTDQMIKNLLPANSINPDTKVVLVNTILFLGKWMEAFDPQQTIKNQVFYGFEDDAPKSKKLKSNVDYMIRTDSKELYFENDKIQALTLLYKDNSTRISFLKPKINKKSEFDAMEKQFQKEGLSMIQTEVDPAILSMLQEIGAKKRKIAFMKIPKLNFECEIPNLQDILPLIGIKEIFIPGVADFRKMVSEAQKKDLFVSSVVHKARIEMDEIGTKAAAATAVLIAVNAFIDAPMDPEFILDSPFIFAISHIQTNTILFYGRILSL